MNGDKTGHKGTRKGNEMTYNIDLTDGLVQEIAICKPAGNGSLVVMDTEQLTERLDIDTMTTYVIYQGKRYEVQGSAMFGYIEVAQ